MKGSEGLKATMKKMVKTLKVSLVISIFLILVAAVSAAGVMIKLDSEEAKLEFINILETSPWTIYYNIGVFQHKWGSNDKAIKAFEKSLELNEEYGRAYYALSVLHREEGDLDLAIEHAEYAAEFDGTASRHFDYAVMLVERFRNKEATGSLKFDDLYDLEDAVEEYETVSEIESDFPNAEENANIVRSVLDFYLNEFTSEQ